MLINSLRMTPDLALSIADRLSVESAELGTELNELQEDSRSIVRDSEEIDRTQVTAGSLADAISELEEQIDKNEVTDASFEAYVLRVDTLLNRVGISDSFMSVIPSFESDDGETKTEDKAAAGAKQGKNILQRIWAWIVRAFKQLVSVVGAFIKRVRFSSTRLKKYLADCADLLSKNKDVTADNVTITVKGNVRNALTDHGRLVDLPQAVTNLEHDSVNFVENWLNIFKELADLPSVTEIAKDLGKSMKMTAIAGTLYSKVNGKNNGVWHLTPGRELVVEISNNKVSGVIGSKAYLKNDLETSAQDVKAISPEFALPQIQKLQQWLDKWDRLQEKAQRFIDEIGKKANSSMAQISREFEKRVKMRAAGKPADYRQYGDDVGEGFDDFAETMEKGVSQLNSLCKMASTGYSIAIPVFMAEAKYLTDFAMQSAKACIKASK